MRDEKISESLMNYRINGYNQLMDQDALNYVLKNNVMELPFIYNTQLCCIEDVKRFKDGKKMQVLKEYFKIPYNVVNFDEIIKKAKVLHYSGSLKPWNQANVAESDLWVYYYYNSPFKDLILRKRIKNKKKVNIINKFFRRIRRYRFMHGFIRRKK